MISFFMAVVLFISYLAADCTHPEALIASAIFWLAYITYVKQQILFNNIEKDKVNNEKE